MAQSANQRFGSRDRSVSSADPTGGFATESDDGVDTGILLLLAGVADSRSESVCEW